MSDDIRRKLAKDIIKLKSALIAAKVSLELVEWGGIWGICPFCMAGKEMDHNQHREDCEYILTMRLIEDTLRDTE